MSTETTTARYEAILGRVGEVADRYASDRQERQLRRELDPHDFLDLAEGGFLLTGVPAEVGGLWEDVARSTRPVATILRTLARGDPSVALVASMHPGVLAMWLATPEVPAAFSDRWRAQRSEVAESAADGHWWGTITSEPGSGGDVFQTKARATPSADGHWEIRGEKSFGSGSGITSFMITSAIAEGEETPDWYFLDVRDAPWDGSTGIRLAAPWDGHGMVATQSHAFALEGAPATRIAWPGNLDELAHNAMPFIGVTFTAVVIGIVEEAMETARSGLRADADELRPYARVEWARAETEAWSASQAFEGMLRAVEAKSAPHRDVLMGKTVVAELSESVLRRLCRIIGGGTLARRSPFGFWFEDVRSLGFLRPPWHLAFDSLFSTAWEEVD